MPPLRDRPGDVPELAHYFLYRYDQELGRDFRGFAPEALQLLESYSWPGNVRELQSVIKQAMLRAVGPIVRADFLPANLQTPEPPACATRAEPSSFDLAAFVDTLLQRGERGLHAKVTDAAERILFSRVLRATHGRQAQACEILGLARATLRSKLRALALAVDRVVVDEGGEQAATDE